ncbi:MAG: alkaline phosphatase family protein [Dehalococcoidia bacterium]|nr:alkaline phosphatase family protein [Dehalococcoidia bacterium]
MVSFGATTHFLGTHAAIRLDDVVASRIRVAARVLGMVVIGFFAVLLGERGLPHSFEGAAWESSAQLALLAIATVGYLAAWRWEGLGGSLVIIGGFGLGVLASMRYEPGAAFMEALLVATPGVLFLLHWQNRRSRWFVAVTLMALAALMTAGGVASARIYDFYNGPTHPQSDTPAIPIDLVEWIWAGGVTTEGFAVKAEPEDDDATLDLVVGTDRELAQGTRVRGVSGADGDVVAFEVHGLAAGTTYYYAVALGDHLDRGRMGTVTTFPEGPASFSFVMASCQRTGSNGVVFDRIRAVDPLFFLMTGDFHYEDIAGDNDEAIEEVYELQLTRPAQQAMYLEVPVVYSWDDHDFGGDGSNRTANSRTAMREGYRLFVPHYELEVEGDGAIYQAFTAGRLRFIVTDTRSERDPAGVAGVRSMLGAEQKAWLKEELLAAKEAGLVAVWVNSVPWIAPALEGGDNWGGFAEEREELATFIHENGIANLFMVSGDAHMLAADDGTNSQYADTDEPGFVVLHAAALDRRGHVKGGPYTEGAYPGSGQFGLVTVTDTGGDTIAFSFSGQDYTGAEIVHLDFAIDVP